MSGTPIRIALAVFLCGTGAGCALSPGQAGPGGARTVDLGTLSLGEGLRASGRTLAPRVDGARSGVYVSAAAGEGAAWVEGLEFETGTIELEVKGKDVLQQSFLGVAFAGSN